MKRILWKLIVLISIIMFHWVGFSDNVSGEVYVLNPKIWDPEAVSWINLPWIVKYDWEWWDDLLILAKDMLNRAIEYLPMLVLILLLLACVKIIFDWDWKEWLKRIKYIIIWVVLMIICIYVMNILSTIIVWHPVLNINFHKW